VEQAFMPAFSADLLRLTRGPAERFVWWGDWEPHLWLERILILFSLLLFFNPPYLSSAF
jgi:hypothetical protein